MIEKKKTLTLVAVLAALFFAPHAFSEEGRLLKRLLAKRAIQNSSTALFNIDKYIS